MNTNIKNNIKYLLFILTLSIVFINSGCHQNTTETGSAPPTLENIPKTMSYTVPYNDIINDNDELGWYRKTDEDDFSKEITKDADCTDQKVINEIYNLINTDNFKENGHIDSLDEIIQSVNNHPPIQLKFDQFYSVLIYPNDVIVTSTFYSSGEKYEELANQYYEEHGNYPSAVTDGFYKFTSDKKTYDAVSKILLNL